MNPEIIKKKAEEGDPYALYLLAQWYELGEEGLETSQEKSVECTIRSALGGYLYSQYHLGCMYLEGNGVEQSYSEGIKWLTIAAEKGFTPAISTLAYIYMDGKYVEKSEEKALEYFRQAADRGDLDAADYLENLLLVEWGAA